FWVNPYTLGNLDVTVNEIVDAINAQNTVNPAGQVGAEPAPRGQSYTATVRAQGRLVTPQEFDNVIVRARPDGSFVRMKDVARADLGAQNYTSTAYLDGRPAALIAIYQLPGSNAVDTVRQARALMEQMKSRFPDDLEYVVALDTTVAVTEGIREIVITLFEALVLVILVVFVFLQGVRTTLIPLLAVPVSLVGTFAVFPLLGFSINTLSLFGLVLAIGLVVDDAIVVVEAGEPHLAGGLAAARGGSEGDGRSVGPRGGHRPHSGRCVRAHCFHPGHHWADVPAVRGYHGPVRRHLGLQRSDLEPRARGDAPAPETGDPRAARRILPLVQSLVRPGHRRLRNNLRPAHPQGGFLDADARSDSGPRGPRRVAPALQLRPRRGSGLFLPERPASPGGVAPAHRRGGAADRRHPEGDARGEVRQPGKRLQPAQPRVHHLQCLLLHHPRSLGRAGSQGAHR